MLKLLRCPFCGASADTIEEEDYKGAPAYYVACRQSCSKYSGRDDKINPPLEGHCMGSLQKEALCDTEKEAASLWNTRWTPGEGDDIWSHEEKDIEVKLTEKGENKEAVCPFCTYNNILFPETPKYKPNDACRHLSSTEEDDSVAVFTDFAQREDLEVIYNELKAEGD